GGPVDGPAVRGRAALVRVPPLYAWVLRSLFPREVPRWFCLGVSGIDAIGLVVVAGLPVVVFTRLRDPGSLVAVVTVLVLFVCVLWALRNRRRDAGIAALGAVLLAAGVVHDVLRYSHFIESTIDLASMGMLAFLFTQGVALGNRLFATWEENIALNTKLTGLNRDLDAKVAIRT